MRILLVTDAWFPQINGVVRTLSTVKKELEQAGHAIQVISPEAFRTIPCPTYPEIRLALFPGRHIRKAIDEFDPDAIHIATEGPLGWAARKVCLRRKLPFTTSFHTKFPEYVHARFRIPVSWSYALMRRFHNAGRGVMVATPSLAETLKRQNFRTIKMWTRGVDLALFRPYGKAALDDPRPVFLFCGRVAVEKNISAFLDADLPGTKVVVGDGPMREALARKHPNVHFTGYKTGEDLARHVAAADVFVFPSLTDTFGLVLLEALACGVPVAAYPVTGPIDVILSDAVGCLDNDLAKAARATLDKDPAACRAYAEQYSWANCARLFLDNLHPRRPVEDATLPVAAAAE